MEQERAQNQLQQQVRAPTLKCPRCGSMNTRFRYYNNHSISQPRYHCRTCKRQWTVGGKLRHIPVGGNIKNKQTKVSCLRSGNTSSQPQQLQSGAPLHESQFLTPMAPTVPQNFDAAGIQQVTNFLEPMSPPRSFYFNDEISCLDAIQSLIQPEVMVHTVNLGNQFGGGSVDMEFLPGWNFPSMAPPQEALPQEIPGYQNRANIATQMVQDNWPYNFLTQDAINDFNVSSNNSLWNNTSGTITDTEMPATSVNLNQWPNFPGYGPL